MENLDLKDLRRVKLKNTIANFIVPVISGSLSLALLALLIYPSMGKITELELEVEQKTTLANQLESKVKKLNDLADFKSSVEENNALVAKALSVEPLVPQLLTQIDLIGRESGIGVSKLSYSTSGTSQAAAAYNIVSINLGSNSTFAQLVTFLGNLESAARLINVNSLRYGYDNDAGTVSSTFILVSPYVQVQSTAVTDDPITFDLSDKRFQDVMSKLKALRYYEISIEDIVFTIPATPEDSTESVVVVEDVETETTEEITDGTTDIPTP